MIDSTVDLSELNSGLDTNMSGHLGMRFTAITPEYLEMSMPVDQRTVQPVGILNGGASAALAETVGSMAAYLSVDRSKFFAVGLELKCNHLRPAIGGLVFGRATPIHLGRKTHVWQVQIRDEKDKAVCHATITMQIISLIEQPQMAQMLSKSPLGKLTTQ